MLLILRLLGCDDIFASHSPMLPWTCWSMNEPTVCTCLMTLWRACSRRMGGWTRSRAGARQG